MNAEAHLFNLFPDVEFVALRSNVESHSNRDYSWFGSIPGDEYGRAIITVLGGKLGVMVTRPGKGYMVLPIGGDGLYEVLEIDESRFPDPNDVDPLISRDPPSTVSTTRTMSRTATRVGTRSLLGGLIWLFDWRFVATDGNVPAFVPLPDDGSVIDVMIVYTHGATTVTDFPGDSLAHDEPHAPPWSLLNQIRLAIDYTNLTFVESGVQTRLKMVPNYPWEEVTHVDTGSPSLDNVVMRDLETVTTMREEVAADLVVIITSGDDEQDPEWSIETDKCGAGTGSEHGAVIDASCLNWFIVAHEIGHKLKLAHDWYTSIHKDGFPEPTSWASESDAHGFVQIGSQNNVRTPMSYRLYCDALRVTCRPVRWSNPADYSFNNLPLGIWQGQPYPSNEVRVLNQTRVEIARNKDSICRVLSQC